MMNSLIWRTCFMFFALELVKKRRWRRKASSERNILQKEPKHPFNIWARKLQKLASVLQQVKLWIFFLSVFCFFRALAFSSLEHSFFYYFALPVEVQSFLGTKHLPKDFKELNLNSLTDIPLWGSGNYRRYCGHQGSCENSRKEKQRTYSGDPAVTAHSSHSPCPLIHQVTPQIIELVKAVFPQIWYLWRYTLVSTESQAHTATFL